MIRKAFVDFDGTAMDSKNIYYQSVKRAFKAAGIPPIPIQKFGNEVSAGIERFYEKHGLIRKIGLKKIESIRDTYIRKHWDEIVPNPCFEMFLRFCHQMGIPVIILSHNQKHVMEKKFEEFHMNGLISKIMAVQDKERVFRWVVNSLGNPPQEILYVDDSKEGIVSARNLGIRTIAFTNGYNSKRRLIAAKPDFPRKIDGRFEDIDDFLKITEIAAGMHYER
jgi:HAD superfamily hydrolase (TIGR01509 family)